MIFNSIDFAIFLPIFFTLYWSLSLRSVKSQNFLIVVGSYLFYGWWDYRFLALIFFSTIVDFCIGRSLKNEKDKRIRVALLWTSILVNLGFLGFFKYYNFFIENFVTAFSFFGQEIRPNNLNIILPVGISFYTFQTLSYSIDVYKKKLQPTKDFLAFAAFVSFFPQLVAGPIERASNLLPQILSKRNFTVAQSLQGIRLIIWGLLKKVVIADNLAPSVDDIFVNYSQYPSQILVLGAVFFSFQIYCDFSGYSDIARGTAKLLGIDLMVNFNFPYFSRSIGEFWRKWHISLSTWFRDYLYIPLGGSRAGLYKNSRNVFVIFLVSGFWHGANWTFIIWGSIHACLFLPSFVQKNNRKFLNDIEPGKFIIPKFKETFLIVKTFLLVTIAWVFFRAPSVEVAFDYLNEIFQCDFNGWNYLNPYDNQPLFKEYFLLGLLLIFEYLFITKILPFYSTKRFMGLLIDAALFVFIILNTPVSKSLSFIYFQF
jgi:D-alanyl-lipoteichoic acid acyltransferase DltB (MBOAT superfamily)